MRDIEKLVSKEEPSDYELIRASGDYRHILLDGLLPDANRDARMDIRIEVLPRGPFTRLWTMRFPLVGQRPGREPKKYALSSS